MLRAASLLVATLALAPAIQAQGGVVPPPSRGAAAIPAGTYDLEITFGGGVIEGALTIGYVADSLTARLLVSDHESPIRPGARNGSRLTLESTSPAIAVRYELEFRGETVTGSFTYGGDTGTVTGRRRPVER